MPQETKMEYHKKNKIQFVSTLKMTIFADENQ